MDEKMSVEVDGKKMMMTPSEIQAMKGSLSDKELKMIEGGMSEETIPSDQNMGLESMSNMPMMSEEEKQMFRDLQERGIPDDMIIEIMASAKVGGMVSDDASAVNPSEFGGLPKSGSSPATGNPSMVGGAVAGMGANDMAMYLQNKVNEIKGRTGGAGMGALSGVPTGATIPMPMPTPKNQMRNNSMGADRTFNPMNTLTPTNAPNT